MLSERRHWYTQKSEHKRDEEVMLVFGLLRFEIVKQARAKAGIVCCSAWLKDGNSTTANDTSPRHTHYRRLPGLLAKLTSFKYRALAMILAIAVDPSTPI